MKSLIQRKILSGLTALTLSMGLFAPGEAKAGGDDDDDIVIIGGSPIVEWLIRVLESEIEETAELAELARINGSLIDYLALLDEWAALNIELEDLVAEMEPTETPVVILAFEIEALTEEIATLKEEITAVGEEIVYAKAAGDTAYYEEMMAEWRALRTLSINAKAEKAEAQTELEDVKAELEEEAIADVTSTIETAIWADDVLITSLQQSLDQLQNEAELLEVNLDDYTARMEATLEYIDSWLAKKQALTNILASSFN